MASHKPVYAIAAVLIVLGATSGFASDAVGSAIRARDYVAARALLEPAAAAGDPEAQYLLAGLYQRGEGNDHDRQRAFHWMSLAAERGHGGACFSLSTMYEKGDGVAPDPGAAKRWLLAAATTGHALARKKLSPAAPIVDGAPGAAGERGVIPVREASAAIMPLAPPAAGPFAGWPPLSIAAWRGNAAQVRELLSAGARVEAKDPNGVTAIERGVEGGDLEVIRVLLAAEPHPRSATSAAALLRHAVRSGDAGVPAALLAAGVRPDATGASALLVEAACSGHEESARLLLSAGADPEYRAADGTKALPCAARYDLVPLVTELLRAGARVDSRDPSHRSPLWLAATAGAEATVGILLTAGADAEAADRRGVAPLAAAAGGGHTGVVDRLLRAGVDRDRRSGAGNTALHAAVAHSMVVRQLIAVGADVDARNERGDTPLMIAARLGAEESVDLLLRAGADRRLRNHHGETAAAYARATGHEALARRIENLEPARLGVAGLR